jgi:uncharacterized protein
MKGILPFFVFLVSKAHVMDWSLSIALAAMIIGLAKGGLLGPVAGALILPLLTQTMTVTEAVGVTLPLLMFADVFALRFYWREWDIRYIKILLPISLLGILMGTTLLTTLSDIVLRRTLGVLTLLILFYKLNNGSAKSKSDKEKQDYTPRLWHGYLAGWASGFASSLANAGGPPITIYLLMQKVPPKAFVGTLALFFGVLNWLKMPGFIAADVINLDILRGMVWALPLIPLGVWLGRKGIERFDPKAFDGFMTVMLLIGAFILLFK